MFDRRKLQAQMVLKGYNVSQVAEMLGINSATMYRKLSNDGDFSRAEINQLIDILDIKDIAGIFFAPSVASCNKGRRDRMYLRIKDLMENYSLSRKTVSNMLTEMVSSNRYPASAIVGGTCRRVDADAFQDFMENREMLKHPNMRKYLKPYRKGEGK